MLEIRNKFKSIVSKGIEKPSCFNISTAENKGLDPTDQLVQSLENFSSSKNIKEIMSQAKDEVIKPLDEFVKEHPSLELFVPALIAGGVAGWLDKKLEEKEKAKELTKYLETLDKFTNKVERQAKYYHILNKMNSVVSSNCFLFVSGGFLLSGMFLSGETKNPIPFVTSLGTAVGSVLFAGVTSFLYKDKLMSKDKRSLMVGEHKFVTLPPEGDKLIFYKVEKDGKENKLVPTQIIKLDHQATALSTDKKNSDSFFVNYEGGRMEFPIK